MKARALIRGLYGLAGAERRTREEVEAYQLACLQAVVRNAYDRVPYYRQLFDTGGTHPAKIRTLDDLATIPLTSRGDLQFLPPNEICAKGVDPHSLRSVMTSGSTGAPLTVRRTLFEEKLLLALRAKAVGSFGLGPRARTAVIDHLDAETLQTGTPLQLHQRLGFLPRTVIDWRTPKDDIVRRLQEFRPHIINGPPAMLSALADELTDADHKQLTASIVRTGGEQLAPATRDRLERGFGLPVVDMIGSHEVVFIAMQRLNEPRYRICDESVLVEVLRDGQPVASGETGELVVTALHSFAMPFIRYRLGDGVVRGALDGGYSTLESIEGRTIDRFMLPSGKIVHGYTLGEKIETSELPVQRFQITQEQRDRFRVRLMFRSIPSSVVTPLADGIRSCLEPGVEVHIEQVESFDNNVGKKFYPFISIERLEAWRSAKPTKSHD